MENYLERCLSLEKTSTSTPNCCSKSLMRQDSLSPPYPANQPILLFLQTPRPVPPSLSDLGLSTEQGETQWSLSGLGTEVILISEVWYRGRPDFQVERCTNMPVTVCVFHYYQILPCVNRCSQRTQLPSGGCRATGADTRPHPQQVEVSLQHTLTVTIYTYIYIVDGDS